MNKPINLSNLLTLPRHGHGRGTVCGHKGSHGHGRRAIVHSDAPPGFSPNEVAEGHRDKRPSLDSTSSGATPPEGNLTTRRSTASIPIWAPQLSHENCPVSVRDSAESKDAALALSQAFLLPGDMQKEVESSPDKLLSSFIVNSAKVCFLNLLFLS